MRSSFPPIALTLLLATACTAFGAGGGEMPNRSSGAASRLEARQETPEQKARNAYNAGVRLVQKADELAADAAHQATPPWWPQLRGRLGGPRSS
jgi:hypothetical protein